VRRSLESRKALEKYAKKRRQKGGVHPLHEDLEMLRKEIEWLRFSESACLHLESLKREAAAEAKEQDAPEPERPRASPFVSIQEVSLYPEVWTDRHIIIDGEIEHYHRNKSGENWHMFRDSTGIITALGRRNFFSGRGTLFAVPRRTPAGKQLFLEIRDFHRQP
jgi:hypothetical protein